MIRRLPPLNALKAFEAAARRESFTRAAEELSVTQGAVSQQVKALEATLGVRLFDRERQRLAITAAGREYLGVVRDALDRIALGTQNLVQRQSAGVLTVSTSPDFAAKWLVQRLGRFAESARRDRSPGIGNGTSRRLCAGGRRSRGAAWRRRLGRTRRRAAVRRTAVSGLQPQAGPAHQQGIGSPEISAAAAR